MAWRPLGTVNEVPNNFPLWFFKNRFLYSGREWTPESGLVTAAFKIRRRNVYDEYKEEIAIKN